MNYKNYLCITVACLFPLALTSCPRIAKIQAYNNTPLKITIREGYDSVTLNPRESGEIDFGSNNFDIQSDSGNWRYPRVIPHAGENGPYFDGTIKAQINSDGRIYLLKVSDKFPQSSFEQQPKGYPLKPTQAR